MNVDIDLEQGHAVANELGQLTSLTYYLDFFFVERSAEELPLYLNIAYTLDRYTWGGILFTLLAVWIALWSISLYQYKFEVCNLQGNMIANKNFVNVLEA